MKLRQRADVLNYNGDFLHQPVLTAPRNNSTGNPQAWLDGTSTGSLTDDQYRWSAVIDANSATVGFTNEKGYPAIKIDCLNGTGRGRAVYGSNSGSGASLSPQMLQKYAIPLQPNVSYTITCDVETLNVQGGVGARIVSNVFDAAGNRIASPAMALGALGTSTKIPLTLTFTSGAAATWLIFYLEVALAGIQTAWFSNIRVAPTAGLSRILETQQRTLATNRYRVNDYGTLLNFDASLAKVDLATPIDLSADNFSISFKARPRSSNERIVLNSPGAAQSLLGIRSAGYWTVYQTATSWEVISNAQARNNFFQEVTLTYDRSTSECKFYVEGVLKKTFTKSLNFSNITSISLAGATQFRGDLDNIRIWKGKILNQAEIDNTTFANLPPRDSLILEYLFNEGTGPTVFNTAPLLYANNGTLSASIFDTNVFCVERTGIV